MFTRNTPTHSKHRKYIYVVLSIAAVTCLAIGLIGHDSSEYNGDAAEDLRHRKVPTGFSKVIADVTKLLDESKSVSKDLTGLYDQIKANEDALFNGIRPGLQGAINKIRSSVDWRVRIG